MKKFALPVSVVVLALIWAVLWRTIPTFAEDPKIFEIREKMFIQQCNDIYLNPDEYLGRTVRLEGIYEEEADEESGGTFRYVIRRGPGCCGNDGVAGFEVLFDGTPPPAPNDWVEAVGTVELVSADSLESVVLRLSRLAVMEKRGAEFVDN
ncbi:MAG: hypothetical protein LBT65_00390 [Synergistaceae bacterium]|nr:hypothetical protein [Synergistaceae bacterium]